MQHAFHVLDPQATLNSDKLSRYCWVIWAEDANIDIYKSDNSIQYTTKQVKTSPQKTYCPRSKIDNQLRKAQTSMITNLERHQSINEAPTSSLPSIRSYIDKKFVGEMSVNDFKIWPSSKATSRSHQVEKRAQP